MAVSLALASCGGREYVPRPTGYPRIDFPQHSYKVYDGGKCPFTFKYPAYAQVVPDTGAGTEPCWFNIAFPEFNAEIHLSYKDVSSFKNLYEMAEDARTFAYKHTVKAEDIFDSLYVVPQHRTSGVIYQIAGNTASSVQFYASDSSRHYLRGALYFGTHPNKDSLAPVVRFIKADIDTLIGSLQWK